MRGLKRCELRFILESKHAIYRLVATVLLAGCVQARYVQAQLCTMPPAVPCPSTTQVLTQQQAAKLFNDLVDLKVLIGGVNQPIPYKYPDDGCWIRAHAMYRYVCQTYSSWKVWNYQSAGGPLVACSRYADPANAACVAPALALRARQVNPWGYHVAPMVLVQVGDKPQQMVLDPSLFGAPVTMTDWQNAQNVNKAGLGTLETTIPEIWYHPQGSDNGAGNDCDPGDADPEGTNGQLIGYNLKAAKRAKALGLLRPARLDATDVIVSKIKSFDRSTGKLQLVDTPGTTYTLDMTDPLYPAYADFLQSTLQAFPDAEIRVAYDPSNFAVKDIESTFVETVTALVAGSGGVYAVDFVIHQAQFTLDPSNPGYSQYLSLLQQSYQNQTPLLISADENEMLLYVANVPVK